MDQEVNKKRITKKTVIIIVMTALVILVFLWFMLPGTKYYNEFVLNNGLPVGIGELSEDEASHNDFYYRITTKWNTVCVDYLNRYGGKEKYAVDNSTGFLPSFSSAVFQNRIIGQLEVSFYDEKGNDVAFWQYSDDKKEIHDMTVQKKNRKSFRYCQRF